MEDLLSNEEFIQADTEFRDGFEKALEPLNSFLKTISKPELILGIDVTCIGGCWRINTPISKDYFSEESLKIKQEFIEASEPIHDYIDKFSGTGIIVGINETFTDGVWQIKTPIVEGQCLRNWFWNKKYN
jgi:hypothetical protein